MRLRLTFALRLADDKRARVARACPLRLRVYETVATLEVQELPAVLSLHTECPVPDPSALASVPSRFIFADEGCTTPGQVLDCPEIDRLALRAQEIAGALSLLYDIAISVGPVLGPPFVDNRLVPETDEDARTIASLGRPLVQPPFQGRFNDRTIGRFQLTGELLGRLAERPGVRVYWEARHITSPSATVRELWRTLELSFRAQGRALVRALARFEPAIELGFDEAELRALEVLRGRASHAASRPGHREVAEIDHLAHHHVGRLHALVERVLLTKPTTGPDVDQLLPFREDRSPQDFNRSADPRPVRR